MDGIILIFAIILLIFSWFRKEKSIKNDIRINCLMILFCILIFLYNIKLMIFTGYNFRLVTINKENYSYDVSFWDNNNKEKSQEYKKNNYYNKNMFEINKNIIEKNYLINKLISYLEDAIFEKIVTLIFFVFIFVVVFFLFKVDYIKKYQRMLKDNLFDINHKWIDNKSLEDILISVRASIDNEIYTSEIYEIFSQHFKNKKYGFFVILGNAGEGKTISIRYLSNELLKNIIMQKKILIGRKKTQCNVFTPIILDFSSLKHIHTESDLFNFIVDHIQEEIKGFKWFYKINIIKSNVQKQIKSGFKLGKFILFVDGYDEIDVKTRVELSNILLEFSDKYPYCYLVITSRTAVYNSENYLKINRDRLVWLSPLSKEQIIDLISKWTFDDKNKNQWEIYEKITYNYQLERLAQNPLLLTLILHLYDKSELIIPRTINEFYTNVMKCLLQDWETQKKILNRNTIYYEIKYSVLQNIAYKLYLINRSTLKYTDIISVINPIAKKFGELPKTIFNEIYKYSGIIEKTMNNEYKFYHRSFYEYFLASYLLDNSISIKSFIKENTHYHNVIFFYFSMSADEESLKNYILENFENYSIIEPLLLDSFISDKQIIWKYVQKRLNQKKEKDNSYYQVLGNIAARYNFVQRVIAEHFISEFNSLLLLNDINELIKEREKNILYGLSYFSNEDLLVNLILNNIDKIDLLNFAANSHQRLNNVILEVFVKTISYNAKKQLISGLAKTEKFNVMYTILEKYKELNKTEMEIIFCQFILLTKNQNFISWLDAHSLSKCVPKDILDVTKKWIKEYGWKNKQLQFYQLENRFILVYFMIYTDIIKKHNLVLVSNNLKFISTLIQNELLSKQKITNYYIDIRDFYFKTTSELKYHWKRVKKYKMFFLNPILSRNIQVIVFFIGVFLATFPIIYYRMYYIEQLEFVLRTMKELFEDKKNFDKLLESYKALQNYSTYKISNYLTPNSNFFVFWFSWFFCLYNTFSCMLDKEYNLFYHCYYLLIGLLYLIGFCIVIQNTTLRIISLIIVIVCTGIRLLQHKYNMPSYREPQYSIIRLYLDKDKF